AASPSPRCQYQCVVGESRERELTENNLHPHTHDRPLYLLTLPPSSSFFECLTPLLSSEQAIFFFQELKKKEAKNNCCAKKNCCASSGPLGAVAFSLAYHRTCTHCFAPFFRQLPLQCRSPTKKKHIKNTL
ncbi:Hypothetical protein, putative, partial [Bodo saltans]